LRKLVKALGCKELNEMGTKGIARENRCFCGNGTTKLGLKNNLGVGEDVLAPYPPQKHDILM
jgi:hypothetical protein